MINPIINLQRQLEKVLKKGECHNTPSDNDSGSYEINLPYYGRETPEEWLVWKDKLLKAVDGQSISLGPLRYMFTERLLTDDAKSTFNQAALDIGIHTVDNFNNYFGNDQTYAFYKHKRYLHRHLAKPRSMKLCSLINKFQELNVNLEEFPPDKEGQETAPLHVDETIDAIYHSVLC